MSSKKFTKSSQKRKELQRDIGDESEVFVLPPNLLQKLGINLNHIGCTEETSFNIENVSQGTRKTKSHEENYTTIEKYDKDEKKSDISILETANLMKESVFLSPTFIPEITSADIVNAEIEFSCSEAIDITALNPLNDSEDCMKTEYNTVISNTNLNFGSNNNSDGIEQHSIPLHIYGTDQQKELSVNNVIILNENQCIPHILEENIIVPKYGDIEDNINTPLENNEILKSVNNTGTLSLHTEISLVDTEVALMTKSPLVVDSTKISLVNEKTSIVDAKSSLVDSKTLLVQSKTPVNDLKSPLNNTETSLVNARKAVKSSFKHNTELSSFICQETKSIDIVSNISKNKKFDEVTFDDHSDEAYLSDSSNSNIIIASITENKVQDSQQALFKVKEYQNSNHKINIISEEIPETARLNEILKRSLFSAESKNMLSMTAKDVVNLHPKYSSQVTTNNNNCKNAVEQHSYASHPINGTEDDLNKDLKTQLHENEISDFNSLQFKNFNMLSEAQMMDKEKCSCNQHLLHDDIQVVDLAVPSSHLFVENHSVSKINFNDCLGKNASENIDHVLKNDSNVNQFKDQTAPSIHNAAQTNNAIDDNTLVHNIESQLECKSHSKSQGIEDSNMYLSKGKPDIANNDKVCEIASYLEKFSHILANRRKRNLNMRKQTETNLHTKKTKSKHEKEGVEKPGGVQKNTNTIKKRVAIKSYTRSPKHPRTIAIYYTNAENNVDSITDKISYRNDVVRKEQFCLCRDFGKLTFYESADEYQHIHFQKSINFNMIDLFIEPNYIEYIEKQIRLDAQIFTEEDLSDECLDSICWHAFEEPDYGYIKSFEGSDAPSKKSHHEIEEKVTLSSKHLKTIQSMQTINESNGNSSKNNAIPIVKLSPEKSDSLSINVEYRKTPKRKILDGSSSQPKEFKIDSKSKVSSKPPNNNKFNTAEICENDTEFVKNLKGVYLNTEETKPTELLQYGPGCSQKLTSENNTNVTVVEVGMKRRRSSIARSTPKKYAGPGKVGGSTPAPAAKKRIKCGVCNFVLGSDEWNTHIYDEHCYIAWKDGDAFIDLSDESLLKKISDLVIKGKKLRCTFCDLESKGVKQFLSHIQKCLDKHEQVKTKRNHCHSEKKYKSPRNLQISSEDVTDTSLMKKGKTSSTSRSNQSICDVEETEKHRLTSEVSRKIPNAKKTDQSSPVANNDIRRYLRKRSVDSQPKQSNRKSEQNSYDRLDSNQSPCVLEEPLEKQGKSVQQCKYREYEKNMKQNRNDVDLNLTNLHKIEKSKAKIPDVCDSNTSNIANLVKAQISSEKDVKIKKYERKCGETRASTSHYVVDSKQSNSRTKQKLSKNSKPPNTNKKENECEDKQAFTIQGAEDSELNITQTKNKLSKNSKAPEANKEKTANEDKQAFTDPDTEDSELNIFKTKHILSKNIKVPESNKEKNEREGNKTFTSQGAEDSELNNSKTKKKLSKNSKPPEATKEKSENEDKQAFTDPDTEDSELNITKTKKILSKEKNEREDNITFTSQGAEDSELNKSKTKKKLSKNSKAPKSNKKHECDDKQAFTRKGTEDSELKYSKTKKKLSRHCKSAKSNKEENECENEPAFISQEDSEAEDSKLNNSENKNKSSQNCVTKTTTKVDIEKSDVVITKNDNACQCGVCEKRMHESLWFHHIKNEHNYLAWKSGEVAINLDDIKEVHDHLNIISKNNGGLVCIKCGALRKYSKSYLSHVGSCEGKIEENNLSSENVIASPDISITSSNQNSQTSEVQLNINAKLICAVCDTEVIPKDWKKHAMNKHYNIAWPVGDTPIDVRNHYAVDRYLKVYKRANKNLVCKICNISRVSTSGFYAHILLCGKTEEEIDKFKDVCEVCNQKYLCIYRQQHLQMHKESELAKERKRLALENSFAVQQISELLPSSDSPTTSGRRKAAEKAKTVINNYKEEPSEDKYNCESCEFATDSKKSMKRHKCDKDGGDSEGAAVASSEEESDESAIDSDLSAKEEEVQIKKTKKKKYHKHSGNRPKCLNVPFPVRDPKEYILKSAKDFVAQHYTDKVLFGDWRHSECEPVPDADLARYLPTVQDSCKVYTPDGWATYKRFEVKKDKVHSFFIGSSPQCMSWAPPRHRSEDGVADDNYLAIACHRGMDTPRHECYKTYQHSSLIQIWDFGQFDRLPRLVMGVAFDCGTVWSMSWCASGARDAPGQCDDARLGLLAVACSDGLAYIFSVPHPATLPVIDKLFYKLKPVVELRLTTKENICSQCTAITWSTQKGHDIIIAGYSDGTIAFYNLNCDSPLGHSREDGVTILYPYHDERLHNHCITGVDVMASSACEGEGVGAVCTSCPTGASVTARGGVAPAAAARCSVHCAGAAAIFVPHWPSVLLTDDAVSISELEWFGSSRRPGLSRLFAGCSHCGIAVSSTTPLLRKLNPHPVFNDINKVNLLAIEMKPLSKKVSKRKNTETSMKLEPFTYETSIEQYGLQLTLLSKKDNFVQNVNDVRPERFPLADVISMSFCSSPAHHNRFAIATLAGIIFIVNLL